MGPAPAGTPWWAWALVVVILAVVQAGTTWVTGRRTRRDVSEIKGQVTNQHESNLRADLDELGVQLDQLGGDVADVRGDVGGVHSELRDARHDIEGIRTDARRDRRTLHRLDRTVHTALDRAQRVIDTNHPGTHLRDPDPIT